MSPILLLEEGFFLSSHVLHVAGRGPGSVKSPRNYFDRMEMSFPCALYHGYETTQKQYRNLLKQSLFAYTSYYLTSLGKMRLN